MKRIILICAVLLSPGILSGIALGQEDGEKILVNPLPPVTPMDITVQMLVDQGTIEARATLEETLNQAYVSLELLAFTPQEVEELRESAKDQLGDVVLDDLYIGTDVTTGEIAAFRVTFQGTVRGYLRMLKEAEADLAAAGRSLAEEHGVYDIYALYTDPDKLRDQLLGLFRQAGNEVLREHVGPVLSQEACFPPEVLEAVEEGGQRFASVRNFLEQFEGKIDHTQIVTIDRQRVTAEKVLRQIYDYQQMFCSMGINFKEKIGLRYDHTAVSDFIDRKASFLAEMGIGDFDPVFIMQSLDGVKTFADGVREVERYVKNVAERRGKEYLAEIMKDAKKRMEEAGEEIGIPAVPNLPLHEPPDYSKLAIQNEKYWSGLKFGDKGRVSTFAEAYFKVYGGEQKKAGVASGEAGIHVFHERMNLVQGYADVYLSADTSHFVFDFEILGQKQPQFNEDDSAGEFGDAGSMEECRRIAESNRFGVEFTGEAQGKDPVICKVLRSYHDKRRLWHYALATPSYRADFAIGPIPFYVEAGAKGKLYFDYEIALSPVYMMIAAEPGVSASAYIEGAAGHDAVASVGATANIMIIKAGIPAGGEASFDIAPTGPVAKVRIFADMSYRSLDGDLKAFVRYPWFRVRYCKKFGVKYPCGGGFYQKEVTETLYEWRGMAGKRKIMSWGMDLGPEGTKLTGDLTDAGDQAQADSTTLALRKAQMSLKKNELLGQINGLVDAYNAYAAERAMAEAWIPVYRDYFADERLALEAREQKVADWIVGHGG